VCSWGNKGEDLEVYLDYFKDRDVDNGWVMEMGAGEGIAHSNSFYFTKCEGWSGLLVEPSTKAFAHTAIGTAANPAPPIRLLEEPKAPAIYMWMSWKTTGLLWRENCRLI
jgi:hypothetical protein